MIIGQGAESILELKDNIVIKKRISKNYRINQIDQPIRKFRTRREAKIMTKLSKAIKVPKLIKMDDKEMIIEMSFIKGDKLADVFSLEHCEEIGVTIAKMHNADVIHGDLTTSNMIYNEEGLHLIDFGLSSTSIRVEDKAVDLHLLFQAIESKHHKVYDDAKEIIINKYKEHNPDFKTILKRLYNVESRGRNKH